jgi:outer membrane protein assembly factor BamB/orotate phosphoribosyltransferase
MTLGLSHQVQSDDSGLEYLKQVIKDKVIDLDLAHSLYGTVGEKEWHFDFRKILLQPDYLKLITEVIWKKIENKDNFQLGGLESASIPIVTALVIKAAEMGKNVNGFYIRKSRKKSGLFNRIEGDLNDNPIILLDDLINSGSSILSQVEHLNYLNKKVDLVITLVRFRHDKYYEDLFNGKKMLESIFSIEDFGLKFSLKKKIGSLEKTQIYNPHKAIYKHICSKSTPLLIGDYAYYGTDFDGFIKINKDTGKEVWSVNIGGHSVHKTIFSSPCEFEGVVFFGSYDGKFYALDTESGKAKWIYDDCDWIGSSPCVDRKKGIVFVGLEHGLPGERGSVVAIEISTGNKLWEFKTPAYTHASPIFISQYDQVCIGGNEGILRLFDSTTGNLVWQFETEGGRSYDVNLGFSKADIKMQPAYDAMTDQIAFTSMDGWLYVVSRIDGSLKYRVPSEKNDTTYRIGINGSPFFTEKNVLFAGLDKYVYCCDKLTGRILWSKSTGARIFSSPVVIEGRVFVGNNNGILYEFEEETGIVNSQTYFPDRITNPCVYEEKERVIYVVTHANQLYKVSI